MIRILAYIGGLLLAGFVGWSIRELLSWIFRPARERRQEAKMAAVMEKVFEKNWQKRNPGEPITAPVRVQLSGTSAAVSHAFVASGGFRVRLAGAIVAQPVLRPGEKNGAASDNSANEGPR